ncbi:terminase TerL endonuclease subunit [Corynebacterium epidermidicanis]|uniref:Phage terminase-like protein, large subunit n=1 Tax=Corynebacterium epidermidicanis TaxID=1050174 RepID=A0A0G3GS16_9CORY|nr:terminase TerL endonuclease subunit [Corynebacterium epidermidicanis]AKK02333.1 phage terminase-like protein, large subunit [Corynebacterium epidermidicanis]
MSLKRGPKGPRVLEPLPWKSRAKVGTVEHFRLFCHRFLKVPKGVGALSPFRPRPWQLEAVRPFFEGEAKTNLLCIPRGNGKSGLIAAVSLYRLFYGGEGSAGLVVAQNDTRARALVKTMARMVELNEDLACRCEIYKDKITYPFTDSHVLAVASEQSAVEGEDLTTAIVDEIGFVERDVFEAALLSLKRPGSKLFGIGTPSKPRMRDRSPFWDLVVAARGGDPSVSLVEYGAPDNAASDDWDAIIAANPAYGDFLDAETVRAQAPPKTSEAEWRRARMGVWITQSGESFMPADAWRRQARPGVQIPRGTKVVLALDGSQRWDATVLMMASVSAKPHLEVAGWWFGDHDPDYEVSHAEVEARVLELARQYKVVEVTGDPFLWMRTLQVLEDAGLRVTKFSQSAGRMSPSLAEFKAAALDGNLTHAEDQRLNKHMLAAQIKESGTGMKLDKASKTQHIDGAVASVMAYSRAFWLGSKRFKKKVRSFKR